MSERRVRVGSRGPDACDPDWLRLELAGLNKEESDHLEAMTLGQCWVRVGEDGRLQFHDARKPLPEPVEDKEMVDFWRPDSRRRKVQLQLTDPKRDPYSPQITIQHLCGYDYTPENYEKQVKKLLGYGFECLRSRRREDGRFWEIWFLPGLWAAKGKLKEFVEIVKSPNINNLARLEVAVSFLCHNVSFGTLDASIQRAAMVIDD